VILRKSRNLGILKGIQQGIQERGREIASRMKKSGVPVEQIAEYTGLSPEEISRV
jgi:predicted transposase/invertase (TIGR01784 family)